MSLRARDLAPVALLLALGGFVGAQVMGAGPRNAGHGSHDESLRPARPAPRDPRLPDRRAEVRALLHTPAAAHTYAAAMLGADSLLPRWPHDAGRPVLVWVQPATAIRGWYPALVADARDAFDAWGRVVPVRFAFTNDSAAAVRVRWTDRLAREQQVGNNRLVYTADGAIVSADVTLAVHDDRGTPLPPDVRTLTALHEVGHALGLGHSPDPRDLMAARHVDGSVPLSAADVATARLLYAVPPR